MPETPRSYPYPDDMNARILRGARGAARATMILAALERVIPKIAEVVEHCQPPCAPGVVPDDEIVLLRVKLGDCRALVHAIMES